MSATAWIRWLALEGARLETGDIGRGQEVEGRIGDVDPHVQVGRAVYIDGPGGATVGRDGTGTGPAGTAVTVGGGSVIPRNHRGDWLV